MNYIKTSLCCFFPVDLITIVHPVVQFIIVFFPKAHQESLVQAGMWMLLVLLLPQAQIDLQSLQMVCVRPVVLLLLEVLLVQEEAPQHYGS